MLWDTLKDEASIQNDVDAAVFFSKEIAGVDFDGPCPEELREETIAVAKQLVWSDVVQRCRDMTPEAEAAGPLYAPALSIGAPPRLAARA